MFDVTSSKLLILAVVALLVIGPKDLPALLRTIGRYVAIIKRQAAEFRAQFEEAMRESELEQVKQEVETLSSAAEAQMRAAERALDGELNAAHRDIDSALAGSAREGAHGETPVETSVETSAETLAETLAETRATAEAAADIPAEATADTATRAHPAVAAATAPEGTPAAHRLNGEGEGSAATEAARPKPEGKPDEVGGAAHAPERSGA